MDMENIRGLMNHLSKFGVDSTYICRDTTVFVTARATWNRNFQNGKFIRAICM